MKRYRLTEYKLKKMFLEKSHIKCGGKTRPIGFCERSKLSISKSIILYSFFIVWASRGLS